MMDIYERDAASSNDLTLTNEGLTTNDIFFFVLKTYLEAALCRGSQFKVIVLSPALIRLADSLCYKNLH